MEKEFVPYEIAVKLKELGFDEPCFGKWLSSFQSGWKVYELILEMGMNEEFEDNRNVYLLDGACSAPTFSQAFKFIREKYNLIGLVEGGYDNGKNIFTYVIWEGFKDIITDDYFETPKEAELNCLNELKKMLKENGK